MHLLSVKETNEVAGGSLTLHISTSLPLDYVPVVAKFFEESGGLINLETLDVNQLIEALNAAGLDPTQLKIEFDISYYSAYL